MFLDSNFILSVTSLWFLRLSWCHIKFLIYSILPFLVSLATSCSSLSLSHLHLTFSFFLFIPSLLIDEFKANVHRSLSIPTHSLYRVSYVDWRRLCPSVWLRFGSLHKCILLFNFYCKNIYSLHSQLQLIPIWAHNNHLTFLKTGFKC